MYALSTGIISAQYGNQYPKNRKEVPNPFNNVFRTKDGKWLVLCCPEYDRDYEKIMTLLGRKDLIGNEKYIHCAQVNNNNLNSEVTDILDDAMAKFTRDELMAMFKEHDLACEAAYEPVDIYKDEQAHANNVLAKIPYPSGERFMPTNPVNFGSMGHPEYVIGGSQGAHTVEIMKELGYSDSQIEEAIASGAATGKTGLRKPGQ